MKIGYCVGAVLMTGSLTLAGCDVSTGATCRSQAIIALYQLNELTKNAQSDTTWAVRMREVALDIDAGKCTGADLSAVSNIKQALVSSAETIENKSDIIDGGFDLFGVQSPSESKLKAEMNVISNEISGIANRLDAADEAALLAAGVSLGVQR